MRVTTSAQKKTKQKRDEEEESCCISSKQEEGGGLLHRDRKKPVLLAMFGERHSGTNMMEQLIKRNFDVNITWSYGGKHWWLGEKFEYQRQKLYTDEVDDLAIVVIFRNPIAWLLAMYEEPHYSPKRPSVKSFNDFLHVSPFVSWNSPDPWGWPPPRGARVIESAGDIISLRAIKIRQMMALGQRHARVAAIRYEDFVGDQLRTAEELATKLGLPWSRSCQPQVQPTTSHCGGHVEVERKSNLTTTHRFFRVNTQVGPDENVMSSHIRSTNESTLNGKTAEKLMLLHPQTRVYVCNSLDHDAEKMAGYQDTAMESLCLSVGGEQ